MTSRQLADSPFLLNARHKLRLFGNRVRKLPVPFWRGLVVLLLLIWVTHTLATLFWVLVPEPDVPEPRVRAKPVVETSAADVNVDLDAIQALQLFGTGDGLPLEDLAQVEAEPGIEDDAETTRLNLKLHAVLASSDQSRARAVIADGADQALYRIGEEILEGRNVKLAKVLEKRVILDNNGKFESLWLYTEEDFNTAARTSYQRSEPVRSQPVQREPDHEATVSPSQVKSINDVVRFSVYRQDGQMLGYRIRPGRDRELFEELGLQMNDIVTAVNGIRIYDPRQVRAVYQDLKTATSAQLEIQRDGQTSIINISLDSGD